MKDKGYFIKIFPLSGKKGKTIFLSKNFLRFAKFISSVFLILLIFFILQYGKIYKDSLEVNTMRKKALEYEEKLAKLDYIEKKLFEITRVADRIKIMITPPKEGAYWKSAELLKPVISDLEKIKYFDTIITPLIEDTSSFIMPTQGIMSQGFSNLHPGIDIVAPAGTPVFSPYNGTVLKTGYSNILGLFIIIEHHGGISTKYGHLRRIFVKRGEKIKRGEIIGEVGSSGQSTGPHLHYELLQNNIPTNPLTFSKNPPLFPFFDPLKFFKYKEYNPEKNIYE